MAAKPLKSVLPVTIGVQVALTADGRQVALELYADDPNGVVKVRLAAEDAVALKPPP